METRVYSWGDGRPWHSYAAYCRRHFGGRVRKIAVDAGLSCPNRDGTIGSEGCTFCDNRAFTPSYCSPRKSLTRQIEEESLSIRPEGGTKGFVWPISNLFPIRTLLSRDFGSFMPKRWIIPGFRDW